MDEAALELEELDVIAVDGAISGQVEVADVQADDSVFIGRMPFGVVGTVAEGEETLALPSELSDFESCFGLFVQV